MKLTESAVAAVLEIMKKRRLDPEKVFFEFRPLDNGAIGMGFGLERQGLLFEFGELRVTVDNRINLNSVTVDFGQIENRKGLIFLENK